jgi:branched-chain amino acid transport system ATP-binding protein
MTADVSTPVMLALDAVTAGYGDVTVLRDITLRVHAGEVLALLGRNGMGKTTTLRAVLGMVQVRGGTIAYKQHDLRRLRTYEIARLGIGYVPEGRQLFGPLTVLENLRIPFLNKHPDRSAWNRQRDRLFTLFPRLAERATQRAGTLSGGEQQMLAIARALAGGDQLVMLDEPTEGLAPAIVADIVRALQQLRSEGLTVLMVEQNLDTTFALANRIAILEKGEVALQCTPADLQERDELLQRYLGVGQRR